MLTCLSIAGHSHGVRLAQCNASTATNCSPPFPAGARENSKHMSSGQDNVEMPCCQAQCHSEHLCRHGCHCRRHVHARETQGGIWLNFTFGCGTCICCPANSNEAKPIAVLSPAVCHLPSSQLLLVIAARRCQWFLLLGQAKGTWVLTCAWSWLGVEFFKLH